jgi:DNA-binding CsgD family transcriptional regulator
MLRPVGSRGVSRLSEPALERLLDLVGEAYSFDGLAEFRTGILHAVRRAVPADYVAYNEVGTHPEELVAVVEPQLEPEHFERWAELAHQHPSIAYLRRTHDGRPTRISDHLDDASFRALELYQRFYRPLGVTAQVSFTLPSVAPLIVAIALSRGREFTDEECEILARARPHLIQAYRNARQGDERAAILSALEGGMAELGAAAVVVGRDGRVRHVGAGAAALLADAGRDPLPRLLEWLAATRAAPAGAAVPLRLDTPAGAVRVRPVLGRGPRDPDVLLLQRGDGGLTAAALQALGLTRRESEALRWIALGRTGPEAGRQMGVAARTVAKHLQNVYVKLGVSSRSQAAAVAWASVEAVAAPS